MRRLLLVTLVLAGLGLAAPAAMAKFVFADLGGRTFTPRELIESHMEGCGSGACAREIGGKRAALVPAGVRFSARCRARIVPVGYVGRRGTLRFVMPDVPTGTYQLLVRYFQPRPHVTCLWGYASNPFRVIGSGD